MKKDFLGKTKNSKEVFLDTDLSHAVTHFADQPTLFSVVKKIIPLLELNDDIEQIEWDCQEKIGGTDLVKTDSNDVIVYAKRPLRENYSRFVKNKKSVPTSWVTMDLRKNNKGEYFLYTAFIGRLTPSFPGGDYLPEKSKDFWSKHALVWGSQEIVPGTETDICPW